MTMDDHVSCVYVVFYDIHEREAVDVEGIPSGVKNGRSDHLNRTARTLDNDQNNICRYDIISLGCDIKPEWFPCGATE